MLDGHYRRHSVAHVGPCEINVLLFQDIQFPRICIDHIGEHGLKTCQMSSAFRIIDIVAKSQHIFMKFIHILESDLHRNIFIFPFIIDHIMYGLFGSVHILDKSGNALRLLIFDMFCRTFTPVLIDNRKRRV